MTDLISRSALIEVIFKEWGGDPAYFIGDDNPITDRLAFAAGYAVSLLNNAPAVDAEPRKHGRWIIGFGENGEPIGTYCSECGWSWVNGVAAVHLNKGFSLIKTPRCPWCGAIMEEEKPDGD